MINFIIELLNRPRVDWLRTFVINFHMMSFRDAIKLPIYIYKGVRFKDLTGDIIIINPKRGCIKIGYPNNAASTHGIRSYLSIQGTILFDRYCQIGEGNFIDVYNPESILKFGNNVIINNNNVISCGTKINIGKQVIIGSYCQIFSTDHHYLAKDGVIRSGKFDHVEIGENCWIGNNVTILKNSEIGSCNIVGTKSLVTSKVDYVTGCVLGGNPLRVITREHHVEFIHNVIDCNYIWEQFKTKDFVLLDELPFKYNVRY